MLTDPADLEILTAQDGVTTATFERCFLTVYRAKTSAGVLESVAGVRRKATEDLGLHGLINIADPKFTGRKMDGNTRRVMLEQTEEFSKHTACALHIVPGDGLILALGREIETHPPARRAAGDVPIERGCRYRVGRRLVRGEDGGARLAGCRIDARPRG